MQVVLDASVIFKSLLAEPQKESDSERAPVI